MTRSRREYTDWDIWLGIAYVILGIMDVIFIVIGIVYNLLLYQILSYIFTIKITILVTLFLKGKISFKKNIKDYNLLTKRHIYNYLKKNATNAYTAEMILNYLKENIHDKAFKKFVEKHYHDILADLLTDQQIETTRIDGQEFYLFPTI